MLQFYFLSILLNLLAGLIFIYAVNAGESSGSLPSDPENLSGEDSSDPLAFDDDIGSSSDSSPKEKASSFKSLARPFFGDKNLQLVVGILSVLTALMKLLSPIQFDIAIIGDLVPALAGFAAGAVLLLDWYQERSDVEIPLPEPLQNFYVGGRKYLGIFCIIAAVLHFIFPRVLFL